MNDKNQNKIEFIKYFLEAVLDFGKTFPDLFIRESWHYKDLRIGGYDPNKIYNNLNNLKYRGILRNNGQGNFSFTPKGVKWAEKSALRYFRLKNKKWDKKWRVVIFDIPQELHRERVRFRQKLKNLGFYMLQKSVFIFPYECREELGDICRQLKISDYIDVILAENPGFKEDEIKKYYHL